MKRIFVTLTNMEKERLTEIASGCGATPGELFAAFVADLACSGRTGGSDERMIANDWLCRQTCRWADGKMIT